MSFLGIHFFSKASPCYYLGCSGNSKRMSLVLLKDGNSSKQYVRVEIFYTAEWICFDYPIHPRATVTLKPAHIPALGLSKLCLSSGAFEGWSGGAKGTCILCPRGVRLILAYSWARPAILVAGKCRRGMFLFLLFLHFHSCSSFFPVPLFQLFYYLFYLFFSLSLGDDTQNDPQGLTCR